MSLTIGMIVLVKNKIVEEEVNFQNYHSKDFVFILSFYDPGKWAKYKGESL